MTADQRHPDNPSDQAHATLRVRVSQSALSSARIALYMLAACGVILLVRPRFRDDPKEAAVITLSLTGVAALTFFVFGLLGYQIRGDSIRAPRMLVWAFLFMVALIVLCILLWLEAHNQLSGPK